MTESAMNQILKVAEAEDMNVTAYEGYSGRGMYGETTCALVVSSMGEFAQAVSMATIDSDDPDVLAADLKGIRTDSLGRDIIIY